MINSSFFCVETSGNVGSAVTFTNKLTDGRPRPQVWAGLQIKHMSWGGNEKYENLMKCDGDVFREESSRPLFVRAFSVASPSNRVHFKARRNAKCRRVMGRTQAFVFLLRWPSPGTDSGKSLEISAVTNLNTDIPQEQKQFLSHHKEKLSQGWTLRKGYILCKNKIPIKKYLRKI